MLLFFFLNLASQYFGAYSGRWFSSTSVLRQRNYARTKDMLEGKEVGTGWKFYPFLDHPRTTRIDEIPVKLHRTSSQKKDNNQSNWSCSLCR